jgi:stage V sporulation protein S
MLLKRLLKKYYKYHIFSNLSYISDIEREEFNMETLKVSSKSNPNSVAGALANVFREKGSAEIQAVGAGALNQAIKAVAIARGFVAPSGKNLVCIPAFQDISIDGEERTAIKLIIEAK